MMSTTVVTSTQQELFRQRFAFLLLCLASFMAVLDASIVNVALPSMQTAFGFSTQTLQWVVSMYSLTFGGFLLLSGRAGDLFGRRRLYMIGLALFSLASLAGGLAPSGSWFIVARAIQGFGATLIAPTALALITTLFPEGPERNRAIGIVGSITSLGYATGALLGGLLVAGPGWRWVMFVNVPVGIATFVLAPLFIEKDTARQTSQQHINIVGAILVTGGLIALVYMLAGGAGFGWLSWQTISLFVLTLVVFVAFVLIESRSPAPLVRLGLFRLRTLTGGDLVSLLYGATFVSLMFVLTLYLQLVLGYSAINTGLAFLPMAVAIMVISTLISRFVARVGVKPLVVGGGVVTILGLLLLSGQMTSQSSFAALLPGMLITAIGGGLVFPCLIIAGTAGVSANEQGLASGLVNTSQQVGGSVGLAIATTIATTRTASLMQSGTALGKVALVGGFQAALFACLGFALIAVLVALVVIREKECCNCIAAHVPSEHHHVTRPLAFHLGRLVQRA
jgi:EmrB/QacA subfamily drug resistance transporter